MRTKYYCRCTCVESARPGHRCRSGYLAKEPITTDLQTRTAEGPVEKKNSYTGPEVLRVHHVTDEPDSGKTSAAVDVVEEEMKRSGVGAARNRDTETFFWMKSVRDPSTENDGLHSLAAAASSMAPRSLPQNKHNQRVHTLGRDNKSQRGRLLSVRDRVNTRRCRTFLTPLLTEVGERGAGLRGK